MKIKLAAAALSAAFSLSLLQTPAQAQATCPPGFTLIVIPASLGGGTTCSPNGPGAGGGGGGGGGLNLTPLIRAIQGISSTISSIPAPFAPAPEWHVSAPPPPPPPPDYPDDYDNGPPPDDGARANNYARADRPKAASVPWPIRRGVKTDDAFSLTADGSFVEADGALASVHHDGFTGTTANGTAINVGGFHSTVGTGTVTGSLETRRFFNLDAEQSLKFFGAYAYQHGRINSVDANAFPTARFDVNWFGGGARFTDRGWFAEFAAAGAFGTSGDDTGASYGVSGNTFHVSGGRDINLYGSAVPMTLRLSGSLGRVELNGAAFTDSGGLNVGHQHQQYWSAGAQANLYSYIWQGDLLWRPVVGVSLEQRFNYQDSIDIPAQAGNLADTLQFDEKHTFVGANLGLDALTRWGGTFRVNGAVLHSADQTALIGTVGFRYRFES